MSQCHDNYPGPQAGWTHLPVRVADLMTADPVTVEPTATVREMAEVMLRHDIRAVPVIDIGDRLVGMVSEIDLVCREGYPCVRHHSLAQFVDSNGGSGSQDWSARAEGLTAEEIMSRDVVVCESQEPIGLVTRRMLMKDVRVLPVLEDGRLVGVLSRHDVLRLFDRPDAEVKADLERLLAGPFWSPGHQVQVEVRDGVVVLTGLVHRAIDSQVIAAMVGQVPGVVEVADRLGTM